MRAILCQFLCEYRCVCCHFHSRELVELVDLIEGHYGSVTGSFCFIGLILCSCAMLFVICVFSELNYDIWFECITERERMNEMYLINSVCVLASLFLRKKRLID